MTDRSAALDHVKGLEELELLEFFREATASRPGNWFIGVAEHNPEGEGRIAPPANGWDIRVLAPHDPKQYDADWDAGAPFCREAFCSTCGTGLLSHAKHMVCPVCGTKEYGT